MKTYKTKIIASQESLCLCPVFDIDNAQWICTQRPASSGRMAYIPGKGLFVSMFCDEKDPVRQVTQSMTNVCQDSVLEAFFAFPDTDYPLDSHGYPDNNGLYFNFEINANGALYAKTGYGRTNRMPLTSEELCAAAPKATVSRDGWNAEFFVPELLLRRFDIDEFKAGHKFFCNFYKMSENPAIEHYMSYNPIQSEQPNFHLPRFFAKSIII